MVTIVFNFISTYLYHLMIFIFLSLALGGVGRGLLRLATKEEESFFNIKNIVFGIAVYALVAHFAFKIFSISIPTTAVTILGLGVAYFVYSAFILYKKKMKITFEVYHDLLALVVISSIVIFFSCFFGRTGKLEFILISQGHDIFSWAFMTDIHRGLVQDDFLPASIGHVEGLKYDCTFTYYTFALPGILLGNQSIHNISLFGVLILIWIGLAIAQVLKQVYLSSYGASILGAILAVTGSMLTFRVFWGHFSQAMATLTAIVFILVAVQNNSSLRSKVFLIAILLSCMHLAYPAGFFALLCICLSFILVYYFSENYSSSISLAVLNALKKGLIPVSLGLLLSIMICYQEFTYLVTRSISVTEAGVAGSPFGGLVNPLHMLLLPNSYSFDRALSTATDLSLYASVFIIFIAILISFNMYNVNKKANLHLLLYIFYMGFYLFAYELMGDQYQVWKFLTFSLIPLSFIPIMIYLKLLGYIKSKSTKIYSFSIFLVVFLAISSASLRMHRLAPAPELSLETALQAMVGLKKSAASYQNLHIDLTDDMWKSNYSDEGCSLALSIFGDKHNLYTSCPSFYAQTPIAQIAKLPSLATLKKDTDHKYVMIPGFAEKIMVEGMYAPQPGWGRWNEGKTSSIIIPSEVSEADQAEKYLLTFSPFMQQKISYEINGVKSPAFEIFSQSQLPIVIDPGDESTRMQMFYENANPVSPAELGQNNDTRKLAIVFQDMQPLPKDDQRLYFLGFHGLEGDGMWTAGKNAAILAPYNFEEKSVLSFEVKWVMTGNESEPLIISCGKNVTSLLIDKPGIYQVPLEPGKKTNAVYFTVPKPISPKELGPSEDGRALGFFIVQDSVKITTPSFTQVPQTQKADTPSLVALKGNSDHVFAGVGHKYAITSGLGEKVMLEGMYDSESLGRWSEGSTSSITIASESSEADQNENYLLTFSPFMQQKITYEINGTKSPVLEITSQSQLPILMHPGQESTRLQMFFEKPVSPAELGVSGDTRKLAISFNDLQPLLVDDQRLYFLGFHGLEGDGMWTAGKNAAILAPFNFEEKSVLSFEVKWVMTGNESEPLIISCGKNVTSLLIDKPGVYQVPLEPGKKTNAVYFTVPKPISPKELGQSEDGRALGYFILKDSVKVTAPSESDE